MILHRNLDEHLSITPVNPWFIDEIYRLVDTDREHLGEWLPWVDDADSRDTTREFVEASTADLGKKKSVIWVILLDGAVAGLVSFFNLDWKARRGEIGYWLASGHCGRGVMTRCVQELEKVGFDELGLEKIEIRAAEGNLRSRAVPERLGYRLEGTLRREEVLRDEAVNHVVYGKLGSEYRNLC